MARQKAVDSPPSVAPPIIHDVLGSPGRPLEAQTRKDMERRFNHDFSGVRLHTGSRAEESARAVQAQAYTVGSHIVFGAGKYAPGASAGRSLIAHELTHVVQQSGSSSHTVPANLAVEASGSQAESEARSQEQLPETEPRPKTAAAPALSRMPITLQRIVNVDPAAEANTVLGLFNSICDTGKFSIAGSAIQSQCDTCSSVGCDCLCDVTQDAARTYTIHVLPSVVSFPPQKLFDGSTANVAEASVGPHTNIGPNPDVTIAGPGSDAEFGAFDPKGKANWYEPYIILAHELCGHGRLNQSYSGGTGNRPQHDATIDTENQIAAEHGFPARGHFSDPRQGESYVNKIGDRSKIAFKQTNGQHYEAP